MNTQPQDPQRLRALELSLQARREELGPEDREFLDAFLEAHPAVAAEAAEADRLLDRLSAARVPVRPHLEERLQQAVAGWVREDVLSRPAVTTTESGWRRIWAWLFGTAEGTPRGVSWSTLIMGRSLAFYMGAAVAVCLFLAVSEPEPFQPEVDTYRPPAHETPVEEPPAVEPPGEDAVERRQDRRGK